MAVYAVGFSSSLRHEYLKRKLTLSDAILNAMFYFLAKVPQSLGILAVIFRKKKLKVVDYASYK